MSTGLLKNHLLFEGHLQFLISSHSPQKNFHLFCKIPTKKNRQNTVWWSFLKSSIVICIGSDCLYFDWFVFTEFLSSYFLLQLFKIILGLQHKIVALAPGRKIPALVYSLVFRLFDSRVYRSESWVDQNTFSRVLLLRQLCKHQLFRQIFSCWL